MERNTEVDNYIASAPEGFIPLLEQVRDWIFELTADVPEMQEAFSYRIDVYKYGKKPIFSLAHFKNHCSLITQDKEIRDKFPDELEGFKVSGTSIHFSPQRPISKQLLEKIINLRLANVRGKMR